MSRRLASASISSRHASPAASVGSVSRNESPVPLSTGTYATPSVAASESARSLPFMPPGMINPEKLYEAYLESQQALTSLKAENQLLKAQLADSQLKLTARGKLRKGAASGDDCGVNEFVAEDIKKFGQNYGLFVNPFLDVSIFSARRPRFASDDPIRYNTPDNMVAGLTAELYEAVPARYHDVMALSSGNGTAQSFVKLFRTAASANRSTSLVILRQMAGQIFSINPDYFTSTETPRDTVPEIQRLIGHHVDANGTVSYDRWPPVLYLDTNASKLENRFLNKHLFMMARVVIFGRTSLKQTDRAVSRTVSGYLRPDIVPVRTTFGLIAWIAMIARYVLSKDTRFETSGAASVGHMTQIPYRADFDYYKRYLIESKAANSTWTDHLLATWDREVFAAHNTAKGLTCEPTEIFDQDLTSEIARDMRLLHMETRATPEPMPNTPPPIAKENEGDSDSPTDDGEDIYMPVRQRIEDPVEDSEEESEDSDIPINIKPHHRLAIPEAPAPALITTLAPTPGPADAPGPKRATRKTSKSQAESGPSVHNEIPAAKALPAPAKRGRGGRGRGSKRS